VEAGEPGIAIADAAGAEGADLITLASRRRGGVSRLVLGSTATRVLQAATVPVLLAGAPESDDGHQT
jgi:nucleotide-binding universal stress UspA family protein